MQDTGSRRSSIGDLVIGARNEGGVYSFALAGSVAAGTGANAKAPGSRRPGAGEQEASSLLDGAPLGDLPAAHKSTIDQNAGGFTAAASLGINYLEQSTKAALNGGGAFDVSTVDIGATDSTNAVMATGGAVLSYQKKQNDPDENESDSKSLAGAVSANVVYTRVLAFIRGVRLTSTAADEEGPEVRVWSRREGEVVSVSIALAADGSTNGLAFSGSASLNFIEGVTHAFIAGAVITANGDVEVKARNTLRIWSIGGGVAGSKRTGVGASIGYNHISNDTRAQIVGVGDTRASLVVLGAVTLHAENDNAIYAASVSAGVALSSKAGSTVHEIPTAGAAANDQKARGIAGAFTLAVNIIAPEWSIFGRVHGEDVSQRGVVAMIDDADVTVGEDVRLTALDNSRIAALAGALAIGSEARAFGAALGWNQINRTVRAIVKNARVTTSGAFSATAEAGRGSHAGQATIVGVAIGGAGSKKGVAVGLSAAVNGIITRAEAAIADGSTVDADHGVTVEARDTSSINALTGAVGVSLQSYAGGVGASGNYIDNSVKARVDASTVTSSLGDVEVLAEQEANVRAATIGVAVSAKGKFALAGSLGFQYVNTETIASIVGASRVTAAYNVRVLAENAITVYAGAGQLSISVAGKFAVGAALNVTTIFNRTEALIGPDARVSTTSGQGRTFEDIDGHAVGGVSVEARTDLFVLGVAVGGSVSKGVAAAASGSLNLIESITEARVEATGDADHEGVDSARDVNVVARSDVFMTGVAGALGAGKVGVGIGVDVGVITHRTAAYIGSEATIEADDSVFVRALGTESIVSVSVAAAGASKVAVSASAGVGVLTSRTRAWIGSGATVFARGHVLVSADSDTKSWIASASIAAAGKAAFGVGFQIGVLRKTTEAYIDRGANVTALAHGAPVLVNTGAFRDALGFGAPEVDANANRITIEDHGLQDGDQVLYTADAALGGLRDGVAYYVIRIDADTIQLAATSSDAAAGLAVYIDDGSVPASAPHLLRRAGGNEDGEAYADFKTSAVDTASDTISAEDHGFENGQEVFYFTDAVVLGGLSSEGRFHVIRVDDGRFKLAATREDALAGRAIDLDTTDMDQEQSHHIRALKDESLPEMDNSEVDSTLLSARTERGKHTTGRTGVIVVAVSTNDIGTVGAGVAIAGTGAAALTGAVTVHDIDTRAYIAQGAVINKPSPEQVTQHGAAASDQDVHVNAARHYRSVNVGLSVAGASNVGVAPAFAVPVLKGTTAAYIEGATQGESYDTSVAAQRNVSVTAHAESEMYAATAGAAVAIAGAAFAGSVNVVVVDTDTIASIAGRVRVTAGGNVLVSASDDTRAVNVSGGVGFAAKGFAGAGAVPVTLITKKTTARIGDHAIVDALGKGETSIALVGDRSKERELGDEADSDRARELMGEISDGDHREAGSESMRGVAVQARSSEKIVAVGASVGVGGVAVAVGLSVTVTTVDSDTVALIDGGAKVNQNTVGAHEDQSVDVDARNVLDIHSVAGAVGGAGLGGVGAGVDIGIVRSDTQALVGSGARVSARDAVTVNALSARTIVTAAMSVGIGGFAGIAGGIITYAIGGNFSGTHDHGDALSADDGDAGSFGDTMVSRNLAQVQQSDGGAIEFDPAQSVDNVADTIDLGSTYGLSTGDVVLYDAGAGPAIGGLEDGRTYFAIVDSADPGKVRLAATHAQALAGGAIAIDASAAGGGSHSLSNSASGVGDGARDANRDSLPNGRVGSAINNRGSVTSGTVAGVESGAEIRARHVDVTAVQVLDIHANAGGAGASVAAGVGVGAVIVNVDADVVSYVRPGGRITGDGTGSLDVTANSAVTLVGRGLAGSLAAGGAIAASIVSFNDSSSVHALLGAALEGDEINETPGWEGALIVRGFEQVSVRANGFVSHRTLAGVVAVAGFVGGGPGIIIDKITTTVRAVIGAHAVIGGDDGQPRVGSVTVHAFADVESIPVDDISVFALGIGGLAGLGAGNAEVQITPTVLARIGTDAVVDVDGGVVVEAGANINARVNADGAAGSFGIGIGAMIGKVTITSDVSARVDSRARIKASSIRIKADHTAEGRTETTPSAAGILAGVGTDSRTEVRATVKAEVGDYAELTAHGLRGSNEGAGIVIEAHSSAEAHATARGHSYGLVATAGIGQATAEAHSDTSVNVGDYAPARVGEWRHRARCVREAACERLVGGQRGSPGAGLACGSRRRDRRRHGGVPRQCRADDDRGGCAALRAPGRRQHHRPVRGLVGRHLEGQERRVRHGSYRELGDRIAQRGADRYRYRRRNRRPKRPSGGVGGDSRPLLEILLAHRGRLHARGREIRRRRRLDRPCQHPVRSDDHGSGGRLPRSISRRPGNRRPRSRPGHRRPRRHRRGHNRGLPTRRQPTRGYRFAIANRVAHEYPGRRRRRSGDHDLQSSRGGFGRSRHDDFGVHSAWRNLPHCRIRGEVHRTDA